MSKDWHMVICRRHGLVAHPIGNELFAHLVADHHDLGDCEIRVLSEEQWEDLKVAGELEAPLEKRANTANPGP